MKDLEDLSNKLVANLLAYIRQRQDFIASIATMEPVWAAPMCIIQDIFEPLLGSIDDKFPRQFFLLDNIARSEGIGSVAIKFRIKIYTNNQEAAEYISEFKKNKGITYKFGGKNGKNMDAAIAIFLGTSGCQAFYSIIENILRNSTRHSNKKSIENVIKYNEAFFENNQNTNNDIKPLEINIEFHINDDEHKNNKDEKYNDNFVLVKIYDNMGGWEKEKDGNNKWIFKEDDKIKFILYNGDVDKEEVKSYEDKIILNNYFDPKSKVGRIIDDLGRMEEGSWGLKEIRICASFLRGLKIEEYEASHEPKIISPIIEPSPEDENKGNLGYKFFIPKIKQVLIISKDKEILGLFQEKLNDLTSRGIGIEGDINKILEYQKFGKLTYEFVLIDIDENDNLEFIKDHFLMLPYKTFYLSKNGPTDNILGNTLEKYKVVVKRDFINSLNNSFTVKLLDEDNEFTFNGLKEYEKLILEIRKKWINFLSKNEKLREVGINYIDCGTKPKPDNLVFDAKNCNDLNNKIILLHRYDDLSNIPNHQKPYCIFPFANGLFHPNTSIKNILTPYEYDTINNFKLLNAYFDALEMSETKIWVIDERLFSEAKSKKNIYDVHIFLDHHWKLQNLIISNLLVKEKSFVLEYINFNNQIISETIENNKDKNKFDGLFPEWFKEKVNFLVIHQAIITKIGGKEKFNDFINSLPEEYRPWYIIITSGRGHPPSNEMPNNSKFFDFSDLRRYVIENPNKFLLSKMISSLKEKQ